MSKPPTLREEVQRKSLEALERIYLDHENGKITEAQYSYGLNVLWLTVAGLADDDFTAMMEIARKNKQDGSYFTREYYRSDKGDFAKVINRHDGRVDVELSLRNGLHHSEKTYDFRAERGTMKAAKDKFQTLCDNLIVKGFNQI